MLENVWEFLQCVKTGTKRRNENKLEKIYWVRGEEILFLRFYSVKLMKIR